ncbi:hypothetical protein [Candidatus Entotheonella palauensis]|nr:hypothetical protein [Candidatus Entotheonella palauensis]
MVKQLREVLPIGQRRVEGDLVVINLYETQEAQYRGQANTG